MNDGADVHGPGAEPSPAAPERAIRRTGSPRLKISLNAYSFSGILQQYPGGQGDGMSLFDLLEYAAWHEFDAVDPTGYFFPGYPAPPDPDYLNHFKRRAFELGIGIGAAGVRNNFATADAARRAADVQHVKEWIECAARMGAPMLRVFAGAEPAGYTWEQMAAWLAADLRECAQHAARFGVVLGLQNHSDALRSADQVLRILDMVDSAWLRAFIDTGSFTTADPYDDMKRLVPYAVHWQVKERLYGKDSDIRLDLDRLVAIMREGEYRGYLGIETLAATDDEYDPAMRVARFLKILRMTMEP